MQIDDPSMLSAWPENSGPEHVSELLIFAKDKYEAAVTPDTLPERLKARMLLRHAKLTDAQASKVTTWLDGDRSLAAIKKRVGSRASGGFLFLERPFFDVDIALTIPHVSMTPTLDEIQSSINRCCRSILRVSKQLIVWSSPEDVAAGATIFDEIARDKEIVKVVLLLTGSVEGAKRQVYDYLETFMQYEWLWKEKGGYPSEADKQKEQDARKKPSSAVSESGPYSINTCDPARSEKGRPLPNDDEPFTAGTNVAICLDWTAAGLEARDASKDEIDFEAQPEPEPQ